MHNNYYFLRQLSHELNKSLVGTRLSSCFSQSKDELILVLEGPTHFYIKAHLTASFCCLSFPEEFNRARKNSVDIFPELLDKQVIRVTQYLNERCFSIDFEGTFQLLFKMHGNRSNLILCKGQKPYSLFKNSLTKDKQITIEQQDRYIDQSFAAFLNADNNYKTLFPTFGKVIERHLSSQNYNSRSPEEKWKLIEATLKELDTPKVYLSQEGSEWNLSLIDNGNAQNTYSSYVVGINAFFNKYISNRSLNSEKSSQLGTLGKSISKTKAYIRKSKAKLDELKSRTPYNHLGDLLMANLHNIDGNMSEVTVKNFYNNDHPITIKLNREMSAQKNAENYYRKSKNQNKEYESLKDNIAAKELLLEQLEKEHHAIDSINNLKALRQFNKSAEGSKTKTAVAHKPYTVFHFKGFDIWVGKNSRANDTMLRQHSHKDDLWLHAKDVSGSHVLIKTRHGQATPLYIIEKAAELAAYYSKRKTDSLCPVIYTPRKFVRKRKGDPAGAVVVDKENVVMVQPQKWS